MCDSCKIEIIRCKPADYFFVNRIVVLENSGGA